LRSINPLAVQFVGEEAFESCEDLTCAKFSKKLERFEDMAFLDCTSLEQITIPLKNGLITEDFVFQGCENLRHVDLVEGVFRAIEQTICIGELHETIAALQFEDWKNDMNETVNSIDKLLIIERALGSDDNDDGDLARVIRRWISRTLAKIIRYKAKHQRIIGEAASILQLALPHDIVVVSILPFLELPSYAFEGEEGYEDGDSDSNSDEEMEDWEE
jgi:hypothetical protein